uniref:Putative secreted peptide n=1 Tax=Anopheles braziliensis TaxID=58242 RepID=A0A2M3ZXL9_9DIPT
MLWLFFGVVGFWCVRFFLFFLLCSRVYFMRFFMCARRAGRGVVVRVARRRGRVSFFSGFSSLSREKMMILRSLR